MSQVYTWEMSPGSMWEPFLWEHLWIPRSLSRCIWGLHSGGFYEGSRLVFWDELGESGTPLRKFGVCSGTLVIL